MLLFAGCQNSTSLNSLHYSIRSRVEVNFVNVCGYDTRRAGLPGIILSNSGERMHRDRIPPQRMHAACRIVTRGSCCTKRFAEFNGNCESFCSLEQLVASLCAADEGKSVSGTYYPMTEGGYIRYLYRPSGWTHGHNPPQTSCAP